MVDLPDARVCSVENDDKPIEEFAEELQSDIARMIYEASAEYRETGIGWDTLEQDRKDHFIAMADLSTR